MTYTNLHNVVAPSSSGETTEEVVALVSELIKSAQLKGGDRLPPERALAKQLGVSRPSLRAGLRALASMGVLESRRRAGMFVAGGPPMLDSEPLRLLASLHGFNFDDAFETQSILEVGAAGLAAEHATDEQLATLANEIAEMYASLNDPQRYFAHDICFHRALAAAANNQTLVTLVEMLTAVMYERRRETIEQADVFALELHQQVYRAIRARDPYAARTAICELIAAECALASEEVSSRDSDDSTKGPRAFKNKDLADRNPRSLALTAASEPLAQTGLAEIDQILDELAAGGENLPPLPQDFSRKDIYYDHD